MRQYGWKGNLRELRNVVERAAILADGEQIELADLPDKMDSSTAQRADTSAIHLGGRATIEALENEHIRRMISQTKTMEEAAQILGIDPATLYRKRKKLGSQVV